MDWALRYCLAQVKDNYSERLEMHFTELQTLPLCNNDWYEPFLSSLLLSAFFSLLFSLVSPSPPPLLDNLH